MPASPREQQILDILNKKGRASVQELAGKLSVSAMTIHRDLNRLAAAGLIVKSHGGASLAAPAAGPRDACAMCEKPVNERTAFLLRLSSGEQRRACCAHCGLMLQEMTADVQQVLTADFLHLHVVSAPQAAYLIESGLTVCCVPSVLAFGSEAEARKFQKGFGGSVVDQAGAMRFLKDMMRSA